MKVFLAFSIFGLVASLRSPFICNNASEPTFGEILHLLSPIEINQLGLFSLGEQSKPTSFSGILVNIWQSIFVQISQSFYETKFPLAYLISDGVFTLNLTTHSQEDFAIDAVILKEKHWSQRYVCRFVRELLPSQQPSLSTFCGCWTGGVSLAQYYGERRARDYAPSQSEYDWCVYSDPCQGQFPPSEPHICRITVDPLTSSCLASSKFAWSDHNPPLEQVVSYKLEMRTLKSQHWDEFISSALLSVCQNIRHLPPQLQPLLESCYAAYDHIHLRLLPALCDWIPVYVANALIALTFLSVEDSVASHPLLRFAVAVFLGLFFAVVWVLLVLYRLSHKLLKSDGSGGIPFIGTLLQPTLTAVFIGFSVLFTTDTVQHFVFTQLLAFWANGCFGFPWLGKLYFLVSVGLSVLITYRYGFFEEGSFSHTLLRLLLRSLGGVMMLLQCSPNLDICLALGCAALLRDHILDLSHYLWITLEASRQTPTYLYSTQQPLTAEAYGQQGTVHTAAALRELREFLRTPEGKAQAAKINWKWREANRDDLSARLDHFIKGRYSGKPSTDAARHSNSTDGADTEDEEEQEEGLLFGDEAENNGAAQRKPSAPSPSSSWSRSVFTLLFYALVCLALSAMVGVAVFDVGSGAVGRGTGGGEGHRGFLSALLEELGVLRRHEEL